MPDTADDTAIFVSPAEPAHVRKLLGERAQMSPLPERYGVDFLWRANGAWWGAQRKTISDLLASMRDGRIMREVGQMTTRISMPALVIEGRPQFTTDGVMLKGAYGGEVTLRQWRGLMWSFASQGIVVDQVASAAELVAYVEQMADWSSKAKHTSLTTRPKNVDAAWGKPGNRDWGVYLLQGFDGVGAGVAGEVFDHFGRVPLRWDATREELLQVKGLGPTRVDKMMGALA
jgi:ERCC4-type nuclease